MEDVHCSRELAIWLGAKAPETVWQHRMLRDAGYLLLRDEAGRALFWRRQVAVRSSCEGEP